MFITDFTNGLTLIGGKEILWGTRIERLLKEWKPKKEVQGDCLTLVWGDVNFFGAVLSSRSTFFPEEILVKDRFLHEIILIGEIEFEKHIQVINGINDLIGEPTGHLELPNLSSHNWLHDDIEVSSNYLLSTNVLKIILRN